MKKLLLLFMLSPVFAFAQDCKLKKSTDPFTHESKISTGFHQYNQEALKVSISVDASPTLVDFFIWVKDAGICFNDASYADVLFEGEKSKMRLKNTGSMNCEGAFHFSFKNVSTTNSQLAKIGGKKIASIKLVGNNKSGTLINLSEEQKELLMKSASCVSAEGLTLIKK